MSLFTTSKRLSLKWWRLWWGDTVLNPRTLHYRYLGLWPAETNGFRIKSNKGKQNPQKKPAWPYRLALTMSLSFSFGPPAQIHLSGVANVKFKRYQRCACNLSSAARASGENTNSPGQFGDKGRTPSMTLRHHRGYDSYQLSRETNSMRDGHVGLIFAQAVTLLFDFSNASGTKTVGRLPRDVFGLLSWSSTKARDKYLRWSLVGLCDNRDKQGLFLLRGSLSVYTAFYVVRPS